MGWRRHIRFFAALLLGLAIWALLPVLPPEMRALAGVNGFFLGYLALMLTLAARLSPQDLRAHAEQEDEGAALILALALLAVGVSLATIFLALNRGGLSNGAALFALAAAPLGWATLQVLAAFRYAHLYFSADPDGGLAFPGPLPPGVWDFLYFSFTIGMTAQVSDVQVTSPGLRRVVLFHAVGSFFYNTVILALAVNAALTLSR
jgi:uncharacterized membrane protein